MQCATGNDDFPQRMNGVARRRGTFSELVNSAGHFLFGAWREINVLRLPRSSALKSQYLFVEYLFRPVQALYLQD